MPDGNRVAEALLKREKDDRHSRVSGSVRLLEIRGYDSSYREAPMPIQWTKDVDAALREARTKNRHLFLDFNAAPM